MTKQSNLQEIQARIERLGEIDWRNVPDEDLRLAYYMLKEHTVFNSVTERIVQEMSARLVNGGFCIYPKNVKPTCRDVPDFMYKWPFKMLWQQNKNGGGEGGK